MALNRLFGKNVLITGANGFVGKHLTSKLIDCSATVSTLTRFPSPLQQLEQYIGDLRDNTFVEETVRTSNPNFIFHLAGYKNRTAAIPAFYDAIEHNVIGSLNLFHAASKLDSLEGIIIIGTAEEYGHNQCPFVEDMRESPVSAYSFSKLCLTNLCQVLHLQHKIPFTIIRPSLVYGPEQDESMFLPALIKSLLEGKPFNMTHGKQARDFLYVSDLIDSIVYATKNSQMNGEIFNVGSGKPTMIADIALMVGEMLNKPTLLRMGEIEYRSEEVMDYYVDNSKIRIMLGWTPKVDLKEGLIKTINFFKGVG